MATRGVGRILIVLTATAANGLAQCEVAELEAGVPEPFAHFGCSVSVEGSRLLIGADGGNAFTGSAYVFELSGGSWSQVDELLAGDASNSAMFGTDVALSGSTALIGAMGDDGVVGFNHGAAYVFELQGTIWTEVTKLTASDSAAQDQFGRSVALSGTTAVVGSFNFAAGAAEGAAYVYTGPAWKESARLTASDASSGDHFGIDVAASSDTLLIGAENANGAVSNAGAAYVFDRQGSIWVETAKLFAPDGQTFGVFGCNVALDGNTAVIGDTNASDSHPFSGAAYVFERQGMNWALAAKVSDPEADAGGWSVAVSGDHALVGSLTQKGLAIGENGPVAVLSKEGGTWVQRGRLLASTLDFADSFGTSVALSGDVAFSSSIGFDGGPGADNSGVVHAFQPFAPIVYCTPKVNSAGCTPQIGSTGIPSLTTDHFTIGATEIVAGKNGLFFYGTSGRAAIPLLGGTLCSQPPLRRTLPQTSGGAGGCSGSFAFNFNAWVQAGNDHLLAAGGSVNGQYWYRDPDHPDGLGAGLSDALEFPLCL